MLVRQNFGRRHHASLITVIQRQQHTHQGNQRFPASYISLQEAIHLPATADIVPYFLQYPLLCTCQLKRKILCIKCIEHLSHFLKDISTISFLSVFGVAEDIQLNIKQLFELKAILRPAKHIGIGREVDIPESFRQRHQMIFRQQFGRKCFRQRLLYLLNHRCHHLLNRVRVEETALHLLRRIIIRLQSHRRKFQIFRLVYIGMRHIDTSVENSRFTEDDIFFVQLILA